MIRVTTPKIGGLLNLGVKVTVQVPHPALSQEERENLCFPSPLGGRWPEGPDEGGEQLLLKTSFR